MTQTATAARRRSTPPRRPASWRAAVRRAAVRRLVEARWFSYAIVGVIIANALTLGAETVAPLAGRSVTVLAVLDRAAVAIFVVELLLKLYAYRWRFFRDPWNCFDLAVVAVALVPASGAFAVLRTLRVLRLLRLASAVPSLRRVVATLLAAVPGVLAIVVLLTLVTYVAAVMATSMFGEAVPDRFGSLGTSLWTLFQVMSGEAWPEIADEVMADHPTAWIFFLGYVLVSSFVVLNLFLAVMVNSMETVRADESTGEPEPADRPAPGGVPAEVAGPPATAGDGLASELAVLRAEIVDLRRRLAPDTAVTGAPEERP